MKMPRRARRKSATGLYHIMIRGTGRQLIFEEPRDKVRFLEILEKCKEVSGFALYAYYLMDNHVHLLVQERDEPIEQIVKRIGSRYVYWFNLKYRRSGHLFGDRFRSEPVEDDLYFLTVVRYIHRNPVRAGLCTEPNQYVFSSYAAYAEPNAASIVDTDFLLQMMDRASFIAYHAQEDETQCLDIEENPVVCMTDEQVREQLCAISGCGNIAAFQKLRPADQRRYAAMLKQAGVSMRAIQRLTGLSMGIIAQCKNYE